MSLFPKKVEYPFNINMQQKSDIFAFALLQANIFQIILMLHSFHTNCFLSSKPARIMILKKY